MNNLYTNHLYAYSNYPIFAQFVIKTPTNYKYYAGCIYSDTALTSGLIIGIIK